MTTRLKLSGKLTDCIQLMYRTPAKTVVPLLPDGLELVQRGPWAFWSVQASHIEHLRPSLLPALAGVGYTHVAYRLKVQAMNSRAEVVRGWYDAAVVGESGIAGGLGSRMFGVLATAGKIALQSSDCGVSVQATAGADILIDAVHTPAHLLPGSCFPTVEDARAFSRDASDGLSIVGNNHARQLRIHHKHHSGPVVQTPLAIREARLGYFDAIDQSRHLALEWASRLGPTEVAWQIGEPTPLLIQHRETEPAIQVMGLR